MSSSATRADRCIKKITYDSGKISYELRVKLPGGREISETFTDLKKARARRLEVENQKAGSGVVVSRQVKLQPFEKFAQSWFDSLSGSIKARTLDEYQRIYECYLQTRFGSKPIGSLTVADVRKLRSELVKQSLHAKTIKHVLHVFRRVCDLAVVDGALPSNPVTIASPRNHAVGDHQPFAHKPLTAAQVAQIADHIATKASIYGLVVKFAAYTGLRAAEIEGLQVGDISATHVTVARTSDGTVKSRTSRRKVPLADWLADDMHNYLDTHPRADDKSAPLFSARYGRNVKSVSDGRNADTYNWDKPIDLATFYANYFKPALKALDLPYTHPATETTEAIRGIRFHDLRHTFAVLNLTAGVHFMQVSKWLGHASYTITLNTYGDYIPTEEQVISLPRPSTATSNENVVSLASRRAAQ